MLSINLILPYAAWIVRSFANYVTQVVFVTLWGTFCTFCSTCPPLHSLFFGQEVATKLFSESISSLNMFTGLLNAYSLAFSLESCYSNTLKYHNALIHPAPRGSTAVNGAAEIISFSSAVSIFTPLPSPCPAESVKNRARTRPQVCIDRLRETPSQVEGWCRGFIARAGRPTSNSRRPVRGQC